jgi:hypothetical protein
MKNEGFEISNGCLKILLAIGVFLVFTYIIYVQIFRSTRINSNEDSLIYVLNEEYQGTVSYKEYDKSNHNNPTLYFKDSTEVTINGEFWSIIKKDDSLIKKKGETIITVYRNNVKFILDNKVIISSLK